MKKIFIDGSAGTTGLVIYDRLSGREDIELMTLTGDARKDPAARAEALKAADIAFLCLPDAAAIEAVELLGDEDTVIIDTSTAHRTSAGWAYGFPELSAGHEAKIAASKRIAVPGCHASGFIALVYPLVEAGVLDSSALLTCTSQTGYSGGGKSMIADYESEERSALLDAPRQYALLQQHKHLREMKAQTGLENDPLFMPFVSDFFSGMQVTVPLFREQLREGSTAEDIIRIYKNKYTNGLVSYKDGSEYGGFLSAAALSTKDNMNISVFGNDDRILLTAVYDNLGKGASGAALECLNIVMGNDKTYGLKI